MGPIPRDPSASQAGPQKKTGAFVINKNKKSGAMMSASERAHAH
jgi:hypothetical protein